MKEVQQAGLEAWHSDAREPCKGLFNYTGTGLPSRDSKSIRRFHRHVSWRAAEIVKILYSESRTPHIGIRVGT